VLQGSSSCVVFGVGLGGNNEGKGLGVSGSLEVGMPSESSLVQRVDYHLGDQYLH
jgi:hypothetical protein